jgi:RNA polymerase sigma factor (sigma-70 family)
MANAQLQPAVHTLRDRCIAGEHVGKGDGELLADFLTQRDQSAFTTLVRRHGPMVLGVFRRVLHRAEDAEDSFQATLLLLPRSAVTIRKQESLSSWLHGVAQRMENNSRRAITIRRTHEAHSTAGPTANQVWEAAWHEVQVVLDEEVQCLSATRRHAFVLRCVEGKGCVDAAPKLGLNSPGWAARLRQRCARRRRDLPRPNNDSGSRDCWRRRTVQSTQRRTWLLRGRQRCWNGSGRLRLGVFWKKSDLGHLEPS